MPSLSDLRFCLRSLRINASYSAGVILTLTLAYCAALVSLVINERVLFRPLPFPEADRLLLLWEKSPEYGDRLLPVSPGRFLDWRERGDMFSDITAFSPETRDVAIFREGSPIAAKAQSVFGNYFSVLGGKPLLGRVLRAEESWGGQPPVAVLGYRLWQKLGADPKIVGTELLVDRVSYTVVGVMSSNFGPPLSNPDLWLPLKWWPDSRTEPYFQLGRSLRTIARVKVGPTVEEGRAAFTSMAGHLAQEQADAASEPGVVAGTVPLHLWLVGDLRRPLLLMLGASLLVLGIACANVVHLSWVRTMARQEELAIRSALGARPMDIFRLHVLESLILSLAGGLLGIPLGLWGEQYLTYLSKGQPFADIQGAQGLAAALVVLLSVAIGLGIGLATAFLDVRSRWFGSSLRLTHVRAGGHRSARFRNLLLVVESAFAVVLLILAGLLMRSLYSLALVDPGFRAPNVVTGEISLPLSRYADDRRALDLFQQLIRETRHWPDVQSVGLADGLPLQGLRWTGALTVEGTKPGAGAALEFNHRVVSPEYFETLGVPLLKGRPFNDADAEGAPKVAIVNQALASRCCPGHELLGQRISFQGETGQDSGWLVVVGIAANERLEGLVQDPWPEVFQPLLQDPKRTMALAVRSELPLAKVVGRLEKTLRRIDPMLPLTNPRSLEEILEGSTRPSRLLAILLVAFAVTALALAALGVFALTSFIASRRKREIGIRVALGASRSEIRSLLLWGSMRRVLLGVLLGLGGAVTLARLLGSLLFEVEYLDPLTYVVAVFLACSAAFLATIVPATRASRVDPVRAVSGTD